MLHSRTGHALCASRSSLRCQIRPHSLTLVRPRVACGAAGKRGAGGSPEQPDRERNQKPRRSHDNREDDAPEQASEMELLITSQIKASTTLQDLEDVFNEWGASFNFIHTSAAFTKAANLSGRRPAAVKPLLDRLAGTWDAVLPTSGPQGLANVLWACGKLTFIDSQLWSSTLAALLQHQLGAATSFDVANVVYGMALAAAANRGSVPGLSRAEVVEALGQLAGHMQVLVTHPYMPGVTPQHISNVMWGFAKLGINPGDAQLRSLLQAMARPAMLELAEPQHLANMVYAVSELQQDCGWQPAVKQQVWDQLLAETQLRKVANQGVPQNISNVCMALAHLSSSAAISKAFAQDCVVQLLQGPVAQRFGAWNAQNVANAMWACAKLGLYEQNFLQRAAAAAPSWLPTAAGPDLGQVAWACGILQLKHPQLLAGVAQRSQQLLHQGIRGQKQQFFSSNMVRVPVTVVWAVAVLDMQQLAGDVKDLITSSSVGQSKINPEDASMLWVTHRWLLQHQLLDGQGLAGLLPAEQLAACKAGLQSSSKSLQSVGGLSSHDKVAWQAAQQQQFS